MTPTREAAIYEAYAICARSRQKALHYLRTGRPERALEVLEASRDETMALFGPYWTGTSPWPTEEG